MYQMSVREALLGYDPRPQADATGPRVFSLRSLNSNSYFSIDTHQPWDSSLLRSFGETCRRAWFVNGYHVLLCDRRLFLVSDDGYHFAFPPFGDHLLDAYAEKISGELTIVIVTALHGVHTVLVRHGRTTRETETVCCELCVTFSPVTKIHHLKRNLYGLCCENGQVESLLIHIDNEKTDIPSLRVDLLQKNHSWLQRMSYFSRKRYIHSFFDHYHGYLIVLSNCDVALWTYRSDTRLQLRCTVAIPKNVGAAIVKAFSDQQDTVATLITRYGGLAPILLSKDALNQKKSAWSMAVGGIQLLPNGVIVTDVTLACAERENLILLDKLTSSLVLIGGSEPFKDVHRKSTLSVVSHIPLGKSVSGIGLEMRSGGNDDGIAFIVYGCDSVLMRILRTPRGELLRCQFLYSGPATMTALQTMSPEKRAEVVLDAALSGLPLEQAFMCLDPILEPTSVNEPTLVISSGAVGIVMHVMQELRSISRLCSSFHYWKLIDELTLSRQRLESSCQMVTSILNHGGWLDSPSTPLLVWDSHLSATMKTGQLFTRSLAINAQAKLLQTLLSSAQHATSIVWLYCLLLEGGVMEQFPGTLEEILWGGHPEDTESRLCENILSLRQTNLTSQLVEGSSRLPPQSQLLAKVHSLILEGSSEKAIAFVQEHLLEVEDCQLFTHVATLLEKEFPSSRSRIRLLVCYYGYNQSVAGDILCLLDAISPLDELYSTLTTIFNERFCNDELKGVVLNWMENHDLADYRITTLANLVVNMRLNVDPARTLTGRLFSCLNQEARGVNQQIAHRFSELARSELPVPVSVRLMCLDHAMRSASTEVDQLAQHILQLQQQLSDLVCEHLRCGKGALFDGTTVEKDLKLLQSQYLSERQLYEISGRYEEVGGCRIQLGILRMHSDSPEHVIADALVGELTFNKALGRSACDATKQVLEEYLGMFGASLPLYPFAECLAFDGQDANAAVQLMLQTGVTPSVLFDMMMGLLDGRSNPLFSIGDTLSALSKVVWLTDAHERRICVAHFLECCRGLLAGENRSTSLSDADAEIIIRLEEEVRVRSQTIA